MKNMTSIAVKLMQRIEALEKYIADRPCLDSCCHIGKITDNDDSITALEELPIDFAYFNTRPNLSEFLKAEDRKIDMRVRRDIIESRATLWAIQNTQDKKLTTDDVRDFILKTSGINNNVSTNRQIELIKKVNRWCNTLEYCDNKSLRTFSTASSELISALLDRYEDDYVDMTQIFTDDSDDDRYTEDNENLEIDVLNCIECIQRYVYQQTDDINVFQY